MSETTKRELWEGWCVLELMGHRRLGGWVSEETIAGKAFLRIDVPGPDAVAASAARPEVTLERSYDRPEQKGFVATQFYSADAVYCITPCGPEEALAVARSHQPRPVERWEMQPALPAAQERDRYERDPYQDDDDEDDDDDDRDGF